MATVYRQGWTLDDVQWSKFDRAKAEPWMVAAIKAAALVEFNAPDYVSYLKRVFKDAGADGTLDAIEQWGCEESQHGRALGRWAEMADPDFKLEEAFERFRAGYKPEHFSAPDGVSIRGSRRGEMIARCVVESGTSSYYTAIKDSTEEPVLREIAGRIAADEFRHYKLFFETLHAQDEPDLPFWKKLMVAVGRVTESDDDELAYAYYCANVRRRARHGEASYERQALLPVATHRGSHDASTAATTSTSWCRWWPKSSAQSRANGRCFETGAAPCSGACSSMRAGNEPSGVEPVFRG